MIASIYSLTREEMIILKITDPYSIHRIVYDLFEDIRTDSQKCASEPSGILFVDKGIKRDLRQILILSNRLPQKPVYGSLQSLEVPDSLLSHKRYRFEVVLNPTKRDSKTGKTVPIKGKESILDWFIKKAPSSWGFSIDINTIEIEQTNVLRFNKQKKSVTLASAMIKGVLIITDRNQFAHSFTNGLGRGKAFGFGLLQIEPLI